MKQLDLSVIILAHNEAELIAECITSLGVLDSAEVMVIDDDSTDDTATIAKRHGARVIRHTKKNFAEAREFGKKQVTADWILYVDADETVSPQLAKKILEIIHTDTTVVAYHVTRVNYYLGKRWPKTETQLRLFKRAALRGWLGQLHETAEVTGTTEILTEPLYHHTHRSITEMVTNTNIWSDVEAQLRLTANHPPVTWWRLPRVMLPTFFRYYIQEAGWQVGTVGLIESMYQAFSIFITYAKLWELQHKKS